MQAQQQFQSAEASYRQALALAPGAADLHRKLGDVQVALNRPEPAMQSYAAGLAGRPGQCHGAWRPGQCAVQAGPQRAGGGQLPRRHRAAGGDCRPLTTAWGAACMRWAKQTKRKAHTGKPLRLTPRVAAPMLHYADLLRETRRKEPAIAIYQAALLLEPNNIDALNNLGMALQEDGQLEAALASFRQVALLAPNNPVTHSNIAAVLNAMGQRDAALESCRRAVKLGPKSTAAHVNLGTCLMEMGRLSEAVSSFETVVKLDPHHRRAHVNISATLTRLGRIDQAIVHARKALKINPDWDELHSNLLFYLTHSQDIDAAALFAEHLRYAEHFEAPLRASWPRMAICASRIAGCASVLFPPTCTTTRSRTSSRRSWNTWRCRHAWKS